MLVKSEGWMVETVENGSGGVKIVCSFIFIFFFFAS